MMNDNANISLYKRKVNRKTENNQTKKEMRLT